MGCKFAVLFLIVVFISPPPRVLYKYLEIRMLVESRLFFHQVT